MCNSSGSRVPGLSAFSHRHSPTSQIEVHVLDELVSLTGEVLWMLSQTSYFFGFSITTGWLSQLFSHALIWPVDGMSSLTSFCLFLLATVLDNLNAFFFWGNWPYLKSDKLNVLFLYSIKVYTLCIFFTVVRMCSFVIYNEKKSYTQRKIAKHR